MTDIEYARVVILGTGPAGCTAAIYAARAMLQPLMIAGMQPGGQLTITAEVENYPGFRDAVQGPWLMEQMQAQAEHLGTRIAYDFVSAVDLARRPFVLMGDSGKHYSAEALIIATGAQAKWLGIASEERFKGFGVSACATCDGFFFKGKKVLVVGGGNTALEESLFLTSFAAGGNQEAVWPMDRVLDVADHATGTKVLSDLYRRMSEVPVDTDLDDVWNNLGVSVRGEKLAFDESAPLAGIRRAITMTSDSKL